ncbi:hypothetical protein AMAG_20462 [Allomyces macrogynus ATCC 38327]|uniref:Uncharacterized protein n=1 Tax=Allomyces macrogynus (strain ATCC 38327) TaxID=578462 RepID=A0A0L0T9Y7_ALLM3|nr:hypothetical protein AMAG_20462 [Allomyces macrogynus ATCC 38327]|eukprot:KNE71623.1 hypothetical protein AMAG_20462 [Allomyces macrogynus ATCC 38327]
MPGTHPRSKPPETVVDTRLRDANVLSRNTFESPSSGNALIGSRSHLAVRCLSWFVNYDPGQICLLLYVASQIYL